MEKILYVVDGWDGNAEYFHNEENAKKEFDRRLEVVDDCTFVMDETDRAGNDTYILYKYYDEDLETYYFLTFEKVKFSD
jgi:hypothetical protein